MSAKNFGNQQFYFLTIPKEWEDGKCTPRRYPAFLTFEDLHRKAVTSKKTMSIATVDKNTGKPTVSGNVQPNNCSLGHSCQIDDFITET